jgi:ubiquinone biosynthesis protein
VSSRRRLADAALSGARLIQVVAVAAGTVMRLLPATGRRVFGGRPEPYSRACGLAVSAALWRLGPAFVKFGQMMATRQDVLPAAFCRELMTGLALGAGGRARYGTEATEIGSVAAVTRTRVGGVDVAVKRIHPGAVRQLEIDLDLLRRLTALAMAVVPRSSLPLPQIVEEMCRSIRRQTDLRAEAQTLDRLAPLADALPIVLPRVLHDHSNDEQLVMTWVPDQRTGPPDHRRRSAKRLVLSVYEMLFITGVVHCDLHPGNWWELPDGRIAVVDAGFAYELDDEMRTHFAEFFLGMASANPDICATHALAACATPIPPQREAAFRKDMQELIRSTTGLTAGSFSLARFATRFFLIQRRHQAYSRATFIYPFMALLAIEGQVKQLDPGLNFQSLAGPVVLRAIVNRARAQARTAVPDAVVRVAPAQAAIRADPAPGVA